MTSEKSRSRRRYSAEMQAQVVAACHEEGTSVAKVAMAHGINATVAHHWPQHLHDGSNPSFSDASYFDGFFNASRGSRDLGIPIALVAG